MDSYGVLLKEAREAKNLDLDTVARETSIIRKYIEGLEEEDNSAFPGEAYLMGFLRNYSDYLGTDTETVLTLYKNKQLNIYILLFCSRIHSMCHININTIRSLI